MSCCGKQRMQTPTVVGPQPDLARRSVGSDTVFFQYVGTTGLTAWGAVTGRRYRFDTTGAIAAVDARDGRALTAIPHLRQVHSQ